MFPVRTPLTSSPNGASRPKNPHHAPGHQRGNFHPSKRCDILTSNFGVNEDALKFLYVGRVSRGKRSAASGGCVQNALSTNDKVHLTVVGDGPYADEMKGMLKNYPVTFTGYLSGEPLCRVYASADILYSLHHRHFWQCGA